MGLKGNTYKERVYNQLDEWVKGNPIHNSVDDECCPDFSCCKPNLLQPEEIRKTFKALKIVGDKEIEAWKKDNSLETPNYDKMESMLFGFLGSGINEAAPDKKVHIADGHTEIKADLN